MQEHFKARPEVDLLIACARLNMLPEHVANAEVALGRNIQWKAFLSLAGYHGLLPLFRRHVISGAIDANTMPRDSCDELNRAAERVAQRNLSLSAELIRLLDWFGAAGIRVVPLKGPVLAQFLYGSVALRKMLDIDLLVEERELWKAIDHLRNRGYQLVYNIPRAPGIDRLVLRTTHDVALKSPDGLCRVEIHHQLMSASGGVRQNLQWFSSRLAPMSFMGRSVLGLAPEDLLVYLCEHGAHHMWARLEWLCGISELLRQGFVKDWNQVRKCAAECGVFRRTSAALLLARDLLGAPVPPEFLAPDSSIRNANEAIVNRLKEKPRSEPTVFEELSYQLRTDSGFPAQLRRCAMMLFMPHISDIEAISLPHALWPAYYVVRPVRQLLNPLRGWKARKKEQ